MTQKGRIKDGIKKKRIKGARKMERNRKWGESRVFTVFDATFLPSSLLIASQRHRIKQRVICRNWYCSVFPAFPVPFSISLPWTPYRTLTPLFFPLGYPILLFFIPYFAFLEPRIERIECVYVCVPLLRRPVKFIIVLD